MSRMNRSKSGKQLRHPCRTNGRGGSKSRYEAREARVGLKKENTVEAKEIRITIERRTIRFIVRMRCNL